MKKTISIVLAFVMILSVICIAPVTASADTALTLGKTYSGSSEYSDDYVYYNFTMTTNANVYVQFKTNRNQEFKLSGYYDGSFGWESGSKKMMYYLRKGESYTLTVYGSGNYSVKVYKAPADKIKLSKKSGKFKTTDSAIVPFTYSGTYEYADANLSIKTSNDKVATASFSLNYSTKTGYLTIYPHQIGKAIITLKMAGGNKAKYTVHMTHGIWYIAKGSKAKAPKPLGVKKPKWSSNRKKVVSINKKTGKIKAKKGGRLTLTAKKGKVKYKINTIVTDYIKLGKRTYREVKDVVNNPDKLRIYNVYRGYSKMINGDTKIPVVVVDYGSTNAYGAMVRNKVCAYYDEVLEIHYTYGWDVNNIIGKKRIKAKYIK